jgi:hypothetical protein
MYFYEQLKLLSFSIFLSSTNFHLLHSQLWLFLSSLRVWIYLLRLSFDFVLLFLHNFFFLRLSFIFISIHLCTGRIGRSGSYLLLSYPVIVNISSGNLFYFQSHDSMHKAFCQPRSVALSAGLCRLLTERHTAFLHNVHLRSVSISAWDLFRLGQW